MFRLEQFDVQNEHIHGQYYEERLESPDVTKTFFVQARQEDPNGPDLYLNDFTCITSGASTEVGELGHAVASVPQ